MVNIYNSLAEWSCLELLFSWVSALLTVEDWHWCQHVGHSQPTCSPFHIHKVPSEWRNTEKVFFFFINRIWIATVIASLIVKKAPHPIPLPVRFLFMVRSLISDPMNEFWMPILYNHNSKMNLRRLYWCRLFPRSSRRIISCEEIWLYMFVYRGGIRWRSDIQPD